MSNDLELERLYGSDAMLFDYKPRPSTPLIPSDYFPQAPKEDKQMLSHYRLSTLKERIEHFQAEIEKKRIEEAKRKSFRDGLLGA